MSTIGTRQSAPTGFLKTPSQEWQAKDRRDDAELRETARVDSVAGGDDSTANEADVANRNE